MYARIVGDILDAVRGGASVCAAFYGHPGIFVTPSHDAVRRARAEGYPARMLPAVSAVDCLFADLGVDPAPRLPAVTTTEPPKRSAGVKVADIAQLIDKLKNEAKVI